MWQEINYFLWGGSAGIEKKGGYRRNNYCTWWIIGRCLLFVDSCHDRPSTRLIPVASAMPRLHRVFHNMSSEMAL